MEEQGGLARLQVRAVLPWGQTLEILRLLADSERPSRLWERAVEGNTGSPARETIVSVIRIVSFKD